MKISQILAQTPLPRSLPSTLPDIPQISPERATAGLGAAAEAMRGVTELADRQAMWDERRRELQAEKQRLLDSEESLSLYTETQRQIVERTEFLDKQPDHTNYADAVMQTVDDSYASAFKTASNDRVRGALQQYRDRFKEQQFPVSFAKENKYFKDDQDAFRYRELNNLRFLASRETNPTAREDYLTAGEGLINQHRGTVLTQEDAEKALQGFRKDVEEDQILRDRSSNDPDYLMMKAEELSSGRVKYLDPDTILRYAASYENRAESLIRAEQSRADRDQRETEKVIKDRSGNLRAQYSERILVNKEDVQLELDTDFGNGDLTSKDHEDMITLNTRIKKMVASGEDFPDDSDLVRKLSLDAKSMRPIHKPQQIDWYVGNGLSTKTAVRLKGELAQRWEALRDESKSDIRYRHERADQAGRKDLIGEGIIEREDPIANGLYSLYHEELLGRSSAVDGKEDPLKVMWEILPRYKKALDDRTNLDVDRLKKISRFNSAAEVERARKTMSRGEYEAERRIWTRVLKLQPAPAPAAPQSVPAKPQASPAPAPAAAPKQEKKTESKNPNPKPTSGKDYTPLFPRK